MQSQKGTIRCTEWAERVDGNFVELRNIIGAKIAHQKSTPQKSEWTSSGIFQWMFMCSVAFPKGLSLSQWIFTGNLQWIFTGVFRWIFTFASSGVQSFARSDASTETLRTCLPLSQHSGCSLQRISTVTSRGSGCSLRCAISRPGIRWAPYVYIYLSIYLSIYIYIHYIIV